MSMKLHRGFLVSWVAAILSLMALMVFLVPGPLEVAAQGGEPAATPAVDVGDDPGDIEPGVTPAVDGGDPPAGTRPATRGTNSGLAPDAPPEINVWYGSPQRFGHLGVPQRWVNILGSASDADGIASLQYSLNGGPQQSLTVGPDPWRLVEEGDFNIEIDYQDLQSGSNSVVISARDNSGQTSARIVSVLWEDGNTWSIPYYIDWSTVDDIEDVAQVVDGQWAIESGRLRPVVPGYDRIVAIGDMNWQDYEVTVPVTIYRLITGGPGVGILVRWNGHAADSFQPHYKPLFGGLGWYRHYPGEDAPWLTILGMNNENLAEDRNRQLAMGTTYIFKMRVETVSGGNIRYSLKVWPAGNPEPAGWDLSGYGNAPEMSRGSVLLVAHRSEASFGNVTITPVQDGYTLTANADGPGSVAKDPDKAAYGYGDLVTLTPDPDAHATFEGWSGPDADDLVDNGDGSWSLVMDRNREVTAEFELVGYFVTVSTEGEGKVSLTPENPFDYLEVATLEPQPSAGWRFVDWSGPDAGDLYDNLDGTWSLRVDADKEVTAIFQPGVFLPLVLVSP
jgi:hypothetical protein